MLLFKNIVIIMMNKEEENTYLISLDFIYWLNMANKQLKNASLTFKNLLSRLSLRHLR